MGTRFLAVLVAACSLVLLAPFVAPLVAGRVLVYNDLSWYHLPLRHLYQQALHAGDSVLWTPSIFAGVYLQGEGQVGLFHPLHQALYRLLPLGPAFGLEILASYPFAFAGMVWFLRRLQFEPAPALFGAMLFAFSGFNLLHFHHVNMVAVIAHLPWLLACADVLLVDPRPRRQWFAFAGVTALIASALLIGFPQAVWWSGLTLVAYAAFRAIESREWRPLVGCAAAVTLGAVLGGVQLLPSADVALHSMRKDLTRDFAMTYSLHPLNLFQLWSPYVLRKGAYSDSDYMWFHEFGIYAGAMGPVALAWAWSRRHVLPGRRSLIVALTVFAAVMLLLVLGRYGGFALLLTYIPVLQSMRAPVRYIVLVQFAFAILTAIALEDLLAIVSGRRPAPARPPWALWLPLGLAVATTVIFNARLVPYARLAFATAPDAVWGVGIVAAVTLLVYGAARQMKWALVALIIVTSADLWNWGIRFVQREPPRTIAELTAMIPPAPADPAEAYAAAPDYGPYSMDVLILRGYRLTSGYVGLFPATRHPLDSDVALQLSGTRWIFTEDGVRQPAQDVIARVRILDEQRQPATGRAQMAVDRPGHLVTDVEVPERRILAFTERFHEGWSATAADVPLRVVRVNGDFLGCLVEPGTHRVELRFLPRSFVYGSIASALGLVLLAGVLVKASRASA